MSDGKKNILFGCQDISRDVNRLVRCVKLNLSRVVVCIANDTDQTLETAFANSDSLAN